MEWNLYGSQARLVAGLSCVIVRPIRQARRDSTGAGGGGVARLTGTGRRGHRETGRGDRNAPEVADEQVADLERRFERDGVVELACQIVLENLRLRMNSALGSPSKASAPATLP